MKNNALTKSDLAWVMIRGFGVFFAYQAISATLLVLNGVFIISNVPIPSGNLHLNPLLPGIFWKANLVPIIFYSILALYFLRHGKWVHKLVMWTKPKRFLPRKDPTAVKTLPEIPNPETTLTPSEEMEFTEWLEADSANSIGKLDDQIARFRDYQTSGK